MSGIFASSAFPGDNMMGCVRRASSWVLLISFDEDIFENSEAREEIQNSYLMNPLLGIEILVYALLRDKYSMSTFFRRKFIHD